MEPWGTPQMILLALIWESFQQRVPSGLSLNGQRMLIVDKTLSSLVHCHSDMNQRLLRKNINVVHLGALLPNQKWGKMSLKKTMWLLLLSHSSKCLCFATPRLSCSFFIFFGYLVILVWCWGLFFVTTQH